MKRIKHDGSAEIPEAVEQSKACWVKYERDGAMAYDWCEYTEIPWDEVLEYCIIPHPDDIPASLSEEAQIASMSLHAAPVDAQVRGDNSELHDKAWELLCGLVSNTNVAINQGSSLIQGSYKYAEQFLVEKKRRQL